MNELMELGLYYDEEETKECLLKPMEGASSFEALAVCINTLGRVDLVQMSMACGKTCQELAFDLGRANLIFQDPAAFDGEEHWSIDKHWLHAPCYLSGNIRKKLKIAQQMNEKFVGCFDSNITALKRKMPDSVGIEDIHISPGAPFPAHIYEDIVQRMFNLSTKPRIVFAKDLGAWKIDIPEEAKNSVVNTMTYGVSEVYAFGNYKNVIISGLKIFEQTMNAKTVKIYDNIPTANWNYERVLNKTHTLMAQEKQKALIRDFDKLIREDEDICDLLEEYYNDKLVCYGVSPYDGTILDFPDINPQVELFPYQKNAIARMILSDENLLLAHDVGAGKTYVMVVGVHERYRMGLSRKNMIVVPNSVLKATVDAHKHLYPQDKILAVYPKDFTPAHRKEILEKIRDEDYVAVYMAYSSFDMIVMSKSYQVSKMMNEITTLANAAANTPHKSEKKMLEKRREALIKKLSKYMEEAQDTPWPAFDDLGIETLVVDEAHNYKNIPLYTKSDNIVGMHSKGSKKCAEMLEKTRVVDKVVFATGTPLTNSLADLFVMQNYLQPEELKHRGIDTFDMWINTFAQRETNFEVDVDSNHLRPMTRFSTFHNLTELMALFATVCDFHHIEAKDDELPAFDGYTDILVPKSEAQGEHINELSERTELIRTHQVKRTEDNLLKITAEGRACALDIRLLGIAKYMIDTGVNKVEMCAGEIYKMYVNNPGTCQLVLCDIGTPKAGFNVYDSLKYELVGLGVPEHQIAFVHDATTDAARTRLFQAVNSGAIRVIVGSTQKLGVGVNIQERLVALHHLSVPWRPADIVQREGRILRRGNTCKNVKIFRYITEGTFDAYSWQLLESKQRFISSFLSGASATRDADDVADVVLDYAEVKALAIGNPLIKERVETSNRLDRAKISYRQRQKQLHDLRNVIDDTPFEIKSLERRRDTTLKDMDLYGKSKAVVPMEERISFGEDLIYAVSANHMQETERLFFEYQGFEVYLPANMDKEKPFVYIRSENGGIYPVKMDTDKPLGCTQRLDHKLEAFGEMVEELENDIAKARRQIEDAKADLECGNMYEFQVEQLTLELDSIDRRLSQEEDNAA